LKKKSKLALGQVQLLLLYEVSYLRRRASQWLSACWYTCKVKSGSCCHAWVAHFCFTSGREKQLEKGVDASTCMTAQLLWVCGPEQEPECAKKTQDSPTEVDVSQKK